MKPRPSSPDGECVIPLPLVAPLPPFINFLLPNSYEPQTPHPVDNRFIINQLFRFRGAAERCNVVQRRGENRRNAKRVCADVLAVL